MNPASQLRRLPSCQATCHGSQDEVPGNSLPSLVTLQEWVRGGLAFLATWSFVLREAVVPRVLSLHSLSEQASSTSCIPGSVLNAGKPKTETYAPVSSV